MIINWRADIGPVTGSLRRLLGRARNLRPVLLGRVAQIMRQTTRENFESEGALATPPWPPLTEAVARRPRIGVLRVTDELFRSLTQPGGRSIMAVHSDGKTLRYGSLLRRHRFHQLGTSKMPARQPIPDPLPARTLEELRVAIRLWVVLGQGGTAAT